jgi:D-alanyl-D-alanine carboxypeptidase
MNNKNEILQSVLNKFIDNKYVFGTSFCIKQKSNLWCGASGNMNTDSQYFIASTTKLYVTAIILHLKSKGILDLDDKISKYLDVDVLKGLHIAERKRLFSGNIHQKPVGSYFRYSGLFPSKKQGR